MNQQVSSGTGSPNLLEMKWVQETRVEALVHTSDNFNVLVAVTLAFLAAVAAAGVALGAGALHPLVIYLILAGCGSCAVFGGIMAFRESKVVHRTRAMLREETQSYYVPSPFTQFNLTAGANVSPSVTLGAFGEPPAVRAAAPNNSGELDIAEQAQPSGESDLADQGQAGGANSDPGK